MPDTDEQKPSQAWMTALTVLQDVTPTAQPHTGLDVCLSLLCEGTTMRHDHPE